MDHNKRRKRTPDGPESGPCVDDMPIVRILPRLMHRGGPGPTWSAICPAHPDGRPSLSVTETADGTVLLHCHAGCEIGRVLEKLELRAADLFASDYARLFAERKGWFRNGSYQSVGDDELPIVPREELEAAHRRSRPGCGLNPLARQLGLPVAELRRLEIGRSDGRWVIPERDGLGRLCGISYRGEDGTKRCMPGSKRGLVIPAGLRIDADETLFLVEGASDTAAALSTGCAAVGRPSAAASRFVVTAILTLLAELKCRSVVVVGDRDDAGVAGAEALTEELQERFYLRVRFGRPMRPFKDVREMVLAGSWEDGLRPKGVMR